MTKVILKVIFLFFKKQILNPWEWGLEIPQRKMSSSSSHLRGFEVALKVSSFFSKNLKPNTWKSNLKSKVFKFHFPSPYQTLLEFINYASGFFFKKKKKHLNNILPLYAKEQLYVVLIIEINY